MTAETSCWSCGRTINSEFAYCSHCGARLATLEAESEATPESAEHQGRRDLAWIGFGLILLGVLGFIGVLVAVSAGLDRPAAERWSVETILAFGGGTILLVIAGTVLAAVKRRWTIASSILGGLTVGVMATCLGALLVVATFVYAFNDCMQGCSGQQHSPQQKN